MSKPRTIKLPVVASGTTMDQKVDSEILEQMAFSCPGTSSMDMMRPSNKTVGVFCLAVTPIQDLATEPL